MLCVLGVQLLREQFQRFHQEMWVETPSEEGRLYWYDLSGQ
jgi:hypothetical protein